MLSRYKNSKLRPNGSSHISLGLPIVSHVLIDSQESVELNDIIEPVLLCTKVFAQCAFVMWHALQFAIAMHNKLSVEELYIGI